MLDNWVCWIHSGSFKKVGREGSDDDGPCERPNHAALSEVAVDAAWNGDNIQAFFTLRA
jgi:hypothetical protein